MVIPRARVAVVQKFYKHIDLQFNIDSFTYFSNKNVVLLGFSGAYLPDEDLVGELEKLAEEVEDYALLGLSVNDPYVLQRYSKNFNSNIGFIADAAGHLTRSLEAGVYTKEYSIGFRTKPFLSVVKKGVVTAMLDKDSKLFNQL